MSAQLTALRTLLEQRFPDAMPGAVARGTARPAATGITELDRALPGGGFPLGKLSVCEPRGGATSILRAACQATVAAGDRAAWIDGSLTIVGASWTDGPLLVRPRGDTQAIGAADLLLRSGGFRLVVLAGVELDSADNVRLVRAVHEGGGAFVALTTRANMAALRLAVRIAPESYRWHHDPFGDPAEAHDVRLHAEVRALGWNARAAFALPVESHELRLSLESGLTDRRGAPTRSGTPTSGNRRSRRRVGDPGAATESGGRDRPERRDGAR